MLGTPIRVVFVCAVLSLLGSARGHAGPRRTSAHTVVAKKLWPAGILLQQKRQSRPPLRHDVHRLRGRLARATQRNIASTVYVQTRETAGSDHIRVVHGTGVVVSKADQKGRVLVLTAWHNFDLDENLQATKGRRPHGAQRLQSKQLQSALVDSHRPTMLVGDKQLDYVILEIKSSRFARGASKYRKHVTLRALEPSLQAAKISAHSIGISSPNHFAESELSATLRSEATSFFGTPTSMISTAKISPEQDLLGVLSAPGMSGSGIFLEKGEMVGLAVANRRDRRNGKILPGTQYLSVQKIRDNLELLLKQKGHSPTLSMRERRRLTELLASIRA